MNLDYKLLSELVALQLGPLSNQDGRSNTMFEKVQKELLNRIEEKDHKLYLELAAIAARAAQTHQPDLSNKNNEEIRALRKQLEEKTFDLLALKTNADRAYQNLQSFSSQLETDRVTKIKEIAEIDKQLNAIGLRTSGKSMKWLHSIIAIAAAVILAIALVLLAQFLGGEAPKSNLNITYDLGEIIKAMLLGSGALVAGVAYAISTVRSQSSE